MLHRWLHHSCFGFLFGRTDNCSSILRALAASTAPLGEHYCEALLSRLAQWATGGGLNVPRFNKAATNYFQSLSCTLGNVPRCTYYRFPHLSECKTFWEECFSGTAIPGIITTKSTDVFPDSATAAEQPTEFPSFKRYRLQYSQLEEHFSIRTVKRYTTSNEQVMQLPGVPLPPHDTTNFIKNVKKLPVKPINFHELFDPVA